VLKGTLYATQRSEGLRACEKIPPRLRAPLNVPGRVARVPISGHVELATLLSFGTPAPCPTRPEAPSLREEIFSQALTLAITEMRIRRERFQSGVIHGTADSKMIKALPAGGLHFE
jgi:hypothetical protein